MWPRARESEHETKTWNICIFYGSPPNTAKVIFKLGLREPWGVRFPGCQLFLDAVGDFGCSAPPLGEGIKV